MITSAVSAVLLVIGVASIHSPQVDPKQADKRLAPKDEKVARDAVYRGGLATSTPAAGKYRGLEIIAMPAVLEELYAKHPREVIELLLTIAEGANPADSMKAVTYATSLLETPAGGAWLARLFQDRKLDIEAKYDEIPPRGDESQRRYFIRKVQEKAKEKLAKKRE
jgi:hypothetical protein